MGDKKWNAETGGWEVDGNPVNYRVSWKSTDSGDEHSQEFTDVDQGYSFYEDMQKSAQACRVTWEHTPW